MALDTYTGFYLSQSDLKGLDALASVKATSRSTILRQAVMAYLKQEGSTAA